MKKLLRPTHLSLYLLLVLSALAIPFQSRAENKVMGEVQFEGKSSVEKTSGVWVDGQYVGYLKELKGSKKVLLLPGEHTIAVRQDGYQDFTRTIVVQPAETQVIQVAMEKAVTGIMPSVTATVKIAVNPSRAAVFVDGLFAGHAGEFGGVGRAMLVAPGSHKIKISLPGYQTFETEISVIANQKLEIKTDLTKVDAVTGSSDNTSGTVIPAPAPATGQTSPPPPPPQ